MAFINVLTPGIIAHSILPCHVTATTNFCGIESERYGGTDGAVEVAGM